MVDLQKHSIYESEGILSALEKINDIPKHLTLFVLDQNDKLIGTLTDGDIRRGFLKGLKLTDKVESFTFRKFSKVSENNIDPIEIKRIKELGVKLLPVVDENNIIVRVIDFSQVKNSLPIDAVIMAGGRGERLRPHTDTVPKPLLKIGEKTIIEHNIDLLRSYGIRNFSISVRYLGEQIESHIGNGSDRDVEINYVHEDIPLGTIGSVSSIKYFAHDYVLVINSDILTNLDYEDFFLDFLNQKADFSVVTIPYKLDIPYAVLETSDNSIISFKEKPSYTYYSNGGIYLIKRELLNKIPKHTFYNTTDLMQDLIESGLNVISFPMRQYWLDIGRPEDFEKAKNDIKHLNFK